MQKRSALRREPTFLLVSVKYYLIRRALPGVSVFVLLMPFLAHSLATVVPLRLAMASNVSPFLMR